MYQIADHPEIRCIEQTGYPSWMDADWDDEDAEGEEETEDAENESMLD